MMLSNVSIAFLGLVDTAVIGHLDDASYLAGIAIATVLFDFLYWGVTFLRMGTTGVVAQGRGANDSVRIRSTLRDALIIAGIIALTMLVFRREILSVGLHILNASAASNLHAGDYFEIKIWGAPGILATMVFIGWLIGMHNARSALVLAAVPCLLHATLDLLFVVKMSLGIPGAAYAALISAYFSAALGIWLIRRELARSGGQTKLPWRWQDVRQLLTLNWNIALRTWCLIATFAFFTHQGAVQGDTILAANAILLNFQLLTALALDGFANALEAQIGLSIGRSNWVQFRTAIKIATRWSVFFALVFAGLYAVFGTLLITLLTNIAEVRLVAGQYLIWAIVLPLVSVWCFVFDGIFIGATKGPEMRNSMIFSAFAVFLPAWYVLHPWGNHGLWLAFLLFFAARGVSMGWYYTKIDWQRNFPNWQRANIDHPVKERARNGRLNH